MNFNFFPLYNYTVTFHCLQTTESPAPDNLFPAILGRVPWKPAQGEDSCVSDLLRVFYEETSKGMRELDRARTLRSSVVPPCINQSLALVCCTWVEEAITYRRSYKGTSLEN